MFIFMQTRTSWMGRELWLVGEHPRQQACSGTFPGKPQHWCPSSETRGLTHHLPSPFLSQMMKLRLWKGHNFSKILNLVIIVVMLLSSTLQMAKVKK